ncbi:PAS domain S-box protein [Oryzomonas sagensis]|uniref:histidine kinase n=1 Tax=Oryzomonas sagensis TaxID=2603857 RepID=A0ABQ6TPI1_9BACT|nr:ATP-binding protein [Oryzomonas sagensis]KAB0670440.1 PAS domain S-box protein [Oryzomonas sagensis]
MWWLELEAQRNELEMRNAELLRSVNETEKVLQEYKELFDLAPVGGVILGPDGCIRTVNRAGAKILGSGPSELVGLRLEQFVPDAARQLYLDFAGKLLGERRQADCEVELVKEGNCSVIRFEGGSSTSGDECLVAMIDITDQRAPDEWVGRPTGNPESRMQALAEELARTKQECSREASRHKKWEETLKDSLMRQRILASHLVTIREEERASVAREIHDELGQMLASLQLNVSLIALEYRDHKQLVARAKQMEQLVSSSIMTVQRISAGLRPVMLDLLGLADAMEWQAQEFRKMSGIPCTINMQPMEKKLDRNLSTAIFRIFQEALTNVVRHSGATRIQADLAVRKGWLTLAVRDDGRGITEEEKKAHFSLGIAGMRERAEAFGGKLRICGSLHRGTILFARVPLGRKEERNAHEDSCSG